jgi:outer membrane protein assembly factor BamB
MSSFAWRAAAAAALAASTVVLAGCSQARPPAPVTPSAQPSAAQPAATITSGATFTPTAPPLAPSTPPQPVRVSVTTPPPPGQQQLPVVTGGQARALWQGSSALGTQLDGGTLLGADGATVYATSAVTGVPLWTATMPPSLKTTMWLLPAGHAVIVESARRIGTPPSLTYYAVSEFTALDLSTGRLLWTLPIGGTYQDPAIVVSGQYLLTGDTSGAVTARLIATGAVIWRDPRTQDCGPPPTDGTDNAGLGLAADGPLAGASFDCGSSVVVQRLDPATGKALWTWRSPAVSAGATQSLALTAAATDGGVLLLAGQIASPPAAQEFTSGLPHAYQWPQALGPADQISTVLALSAADGHPLWSELGGQMETFTLTDAAVCELDSAGMECRDDATGAPTMPVLTTGGSEEAPTAPGYGFTGPGGGIAVAWVRSSDGVSLAVHPVRGRQAMTTIHFAIGNPATASYQVAAIDSGPLGTGAVLVLVQRSAGTSPILALAVPVHA